MKEMSSTNTRKNISVIIDHVKTTGEPFVISRQGRPEVMIIKMPSNFNNKFSEITNINTYSQSFDFLKSEPDLYSIEDIKK
jgi:antitoxin (DNA-binding transcriptional repressor) of toxin-antitoxin stability system